MDFLKNKLLTIVLVLCLAFTIFIGITANKKENTGIIQGTITSTVAPIQKYLYLAGQRISNVFSFVSSISNLIEENNKLKAEVEDLKARQIEYDRFKKENEEMNSLLNFKNTHKDLKLIGANIIAKVGDSWFDVIIIDVGSRDGIKKGQYVIAGNGFVGQVTEVNENNAKVVTLIDEMANIPAKVSSTEDIGLVSGTKSTNKDKLCKISLLPYDTKAKEGDLVVTTNIISEDSSLIQKDILIGKITYIEDEKLNLSKVAYIQPEVDLSRIEKVMVIIK
ncbi:Cell shape-determining protein MreC precursor [Caloramator mitchellensis]|uniref:Cell shape-determining protein MreC n=1 Tax=Caloramator mitchellensis TaxID=908809 RepID=A0A0R3K3J5_CALMK|nr:rod shape-determining protein MreC [Caloramator mitchellensis]KRQ88142.1 Cell shape-determining protein MreC precursor [Caloramator mitchellensis]